MSIDGKNLQVYPKDASRMALLCRFICLSQEAGRSCKTYERLYYHAEANTHQKFTYPDINPANMASINELLKMDLTIDQVEKEL